MFACDLFGVNFIADACPMTNRRASICAFIEKIETLIKIVLDY